MKMSLPIFLLFGIYGVINVYLPLVLRSMGFTPSHVGYLQAIFEIAGLVFPFIFSPYISKKGLHGPFLLIAGLVLSFLPFPLVKIGGFTMTAILLALYATGYKGAVPVSDSMANLLLGDEHAKYGRVRVMGSIGFVIMTLFLQFVVKPETASQNTIIFWMIVPAFLFALSILFIPGLIKRQEVEVHEDSLELKEKKESFFAAFKNFPPIFWVGLIIIFSGYLGMTPSQRFFSMYVYEFLGLEASGFLWALAAIAEIPFMFFANRFLRRYGSMKLLIFCTFFVFVRVITYILIPNFTGAIIGQVFNAFTYGLYHPAAILFVAEHTPRKNLVVGMTLYSIVATGMGNIIGNIVGGVVIENFGYPTLFTSFSLIPLFTVLTYLIFFRKRFSQTKIK